MPEEATTDFDAEIMKELNSVEVFDEKRIPLEQRIALVKRQISEWDTIAFNQKIAFQTNHAIGVPTEQLKPFVDGFTQARKAVKDLEERLALLESERSPRLPRPVSVA